MTPIRDIALRLPCDLLSGFALLTRLPLPNHQGTGAASAWAWPLVGAVLGALGAALASAALWLGLTPGVTAVLVLALGAMLTGGLHEDGLSDTADGLYGGWTKERRLEIMKDSRVGANGVTSFVLLLLLNWAILLDMPPFWLVPALFVMPVIGRCMMVGAITCFPYARPEGMGKAFAEYAGKKSLWLAFFLTVVCVAPWGPLAGAAFLVSAVFTVCFARYITGVLGGLTGDVYGALTLLNEVLVLLVFLLGSQVVG